MTHDQQQEKTGKFIEVFRALADLYHLKNIKYDDSFARRHNSYSKAHYNIERKYDRLQTMAKKGIRTKEQAEALCRELSDMAVYSVMCLMKFCPTHIRHKETFWEFLKKDV